MKSGANINDQRRIARLYANGATAEDISKITGIYQEAVEKFEPKYVKKVNAKLAQERRDAEKAKKAEEAAARATTKALKDLIDDKTPKDK